jgi:hypothetical protein
MWHFPFGFRACILSVAAGHCAHTLLQQLTRIAREHCDVVSEFFTHLAALDDENL